MSLLNKLFSTKGGSATGGKKTKSTIPTGRQAPVLVNAKENIVKTENKKPVSLSAKIDVKSKILSPHNTEKGLNAQKFNQYVFKIPAGVNKIMVANEIKKSYNVKVTSVNVINIPKKARRVGKTVGFKKGYKKAIVTLAKGQTIEIK